MTGPYVAGYCSKAVRIRSVPCILDRPFNDKYPILQGEVGERIGSNEEGTR